MAYPHRCHVFVILVLVLVFLSTIIFILSIHAMFTDILVLVDHFFFGPTMRFFVFILFVLCVCSIVFTIVQPSTYVFSSALHLFVFFIHCKLSSYATYDHDVSS